MTQQLHFWILTSEENENINSKRYMHPMLTAALFLIAKIWKQLKYLLMHVWIKKYDTCVYTRTHTYIHTYSP